jgi:hypothetical protein
MKFQSIDRPINMDEDAIPVYTEEKGDGLVIGVINPSSGKREVIFEISEKGNLKLNVQAPFFIDTDTAKFPFIDLEKF